MFLVGILTWWYNGGWKQRLSLVFDRVARTVDYFSIGLLFMTLFAPFRQISAGSVDGPFGVQLRAVFDQLVSRIIGASMRLFMISFGVTLIILQTLFSIIVLVVWLVLPVLPVIGLLAMAVGWVPSW